MAVNKNNYIASYLLTLYNYTHSTSMLGIQLGKGGLSSISMPEVPNASKSFSVVLFIHNAIESC